MLTAKKIHFISAKNDIFWLALTLNEDSVDKSLKSFEADVLILDIDVEGETYDVESVIFSACKRNGKLVYGFVKQNPNCKEIEPERK